MGLRSWRRQAWWLEICRGSVVTQARRQPLETRDSEGCCLRLTRWSRQFPEQMGHDRHGLALGRARSVRPGMGSGRTPLHVPVQVHRLATYAGDRPIVLQDRRPQRARRRLTVKSTNGDDPGRRSGAGQELLEPGTARIEGTGGERPQVRVRRGQASGVADVGSPGHRDDRITSLDAPAIALPTSSSAVCGGEIMSTDHPRSAITTVPTLNARAQDSRAATSPVNAATATTGWIR